MTTETFTNASIIEFLAANQPDLIKQWHSHVGINALKELAEEFGEKPEPEYPLIDEREVYRFLGCVFGSSEPDLFFDGYESESDFFANEPEPVQKLFELWRDMKCCFTDGEDLEKYDAEVLS